MDKLSQDAAMTPEKCKALVAGMTKSMVSGLARDGEELKMIPSYVSHLDSGHGTFYALDLGGTNFRVLRVELNEHEEDVVRIKNFVIDPAHMQASGSELFDFLAECIHSAVTEFGDETASLQEPIHLGFTFSFPCQQTSIDNGTLLRWTKGFTASGVEGRDVVELLHASLKKLDVHVHVEAVVNDTVGTLMAKRRNDPNTLIGVILGTGNNGCYVENMDRIKKWSGGKVPSGRMCVNMEWGNFGYSEDSRTLLPLTEVDMALDKASLNPGEQIFEKLFGGMYLGDIARRFFNYAVDKDEALSRECCKGRIPDQGLSTELMAEIEQRGEGPEVLLILQTRLGVPDAGAAAAAALVAACRLASDRAARVSACAVAAVAAHVLAAAPPLPEKDVGVAVDGSVFKLYPNFQARMRQTMQEVLGPEVAGRVRLELAEDGSGVGAAVIAATAVAAAAATKAAADSAAL